MMLRPAENAEALVAALADDLTPVTPLRPPLWRAACWLGVVVLLAAVLACFADRGALVHRLATVPDLAVATAGSVLTAVLGAAALFQLSVPGRSARWALLPLPSLLVWIAASGAGCIRAWIPGSMPIASSDEMRGCFLFIVGLSLPLTALTVVMVRRAFPVRPNLTALVAGIAVASAAASLLTLFHPYDASATDLAVHFVAVLVVIGINQTLVPQLRRG